MAKKADPLELARLFMVLKEGKQAINLFYGGKDQWEQLKEQKLSPEDVGALLALDIETPGGAGGTYSKDLITIYEDFALDAIRAAANVMREWARETGREDLLTSGHQMMERATQEDR